MQPITIVAIYFLLWFLSLFLILPFGVRTADEAGVARVPGQAESAPAHFRPWRIIGRTSLLAAALTGLFYANYVEGWVTRQSFDWLFAPPSNIVR